MNTTSVVDSFVRAPSVVFRFSLVTSGWWVTDASAAEWWAGFFGEGRGLIYLKQSARSRDVTKLRPEFNSSRGGQLSIKSLTTTAFGMTSSRRT